MKHFKLKKTNFFSTSTKYIVLIIFIYNQSILSQDNIYIHIELLLFYEYIEITNENLQRKILKKKNQANNGLQ